MMKNLKNSITSSAISVVIFIMTLVANLTIPTVITGAMLASNSAEAAECTLYETLHPNFPLTGAHLSIGKCSSCASCHAGGVFLGTPKVCSTCHNGSPGSLAMGKSSAHIPGNVNCDNCHNTTSFTASWAMNHASVSGTRCDSCHNNLYPAYGAVGKTATHIVTTADCITCHTSKDNPLHTNMDWTIPVDQIHAGITTGCVSCHNGVNAKGKSNYAPGHPITSDQCETCHSINNQFKCAWLDTLMHDIKHWFA